MNWSSFNPPKTTVKRLLLQEDRQKENTTISSLSVDNQLSYHELMERSAAACAEQSSSLSTFLYPSRLRGTQDAITKESSESPSTSLFKADELQNLTESVMNFSTLSSQFAGRSRSALNHFAADESRSIQQSEIHFHQTPSNSTRFPAQTLSSPEKRNAVSNSTDKQVGLSGFTIGNLKHESIITESSFSGKSGKTPFPPVLASGSAPSLSDSGTTKSDPGQLLPSSLLSFSSSASLPLIYSSSPTPSSFPKPTAPTWSSAAMSSGSSFTTSSTANVQTVSLHGSLASTSVIASASFSQAPEDLVASSVAPSLNFPSKSPSTEVPKVSLKTEKKFEVLASSSQPKLQTGTSSSKIEASLPTKPTSEVPTSSQSGSQLSFSDLASSVSHVTMEPKPEQPSAAAPVLSSTSLSGSWTANDGKTDSPDVEFTQEDEMEEEAPESNQTTELTLGSLGGFGIGSAPNPTATKPNPFGAPFTNTSNPPNPPFTMTAPGGELFKPASFSFQSPHPSQPSQPANYSAFTGGFNSGTATQISTGRFGHPAQTGSGQQALGTVLGSFGQSRQLGAGLPGSSVSSVNGFGGFVGNQSSGGFSNAAAGGGFASLASAGGGFSGVASAGGGFSGVASAGGGFSGGGFGAAATAGGGFGAAPVAGGGFGGAASGTFPSAGGGFGAFGNQGSGGFSSFGGGGGVSERPPPHLVTQMRK